MVVHFAKMFTTRILGQLLNAFPVALPPAIWKQFINIQRTVGEEEEEEEVEEGEAQHDFRNSLPELRTGVPS